jgi:hypothetical protein
MSEDSDIGENWKAYREHRREKKAGNVTSSLELLAAKGVPFSVLSVANHHTLVAGRCDFWPSTGKWRDRVTGRTGRGVQKLISHVEPF